MTKNIQDTFLADLSGQPVIVIMVNGFQFKGRLLDSDQSTLLVEANGVEQLIYKTAVSTVRGCVA